MRAEDTVQSVLKRDPAVWDLFTRKEEYGSTGLDEHGRFPFASSRFKEIRRPIASELLLADGFEVLYPEGRAFAVCLTHDVDLLNHQAAVSRILSKGGRKGLRKLLRIANKAVNPYWTFKKIISLEDSYDANSTFFLMGLAPGDEDFNYLVEDMSPELGRIVDSGSDVGLHGGHKAFMSLEKIIEERERLEKAAGRPVVGYRNHYLKIKVPYTWRLLEKAGFDYDSTLGYADTPGFRNGMCHPFHPYDLEEQHELNLLELPLAFMDAALLDRQRPEVGQAWEVIKDLIDRCRKCNGVATIIWHNDKMRKESGKLYEKTMGYCRENGAWMTSGANISKWWRKNGWVKNG